MGNGPGERDRPARSGGTMLEVGGQDSSLSSNDLADEDDGFATYHWETLDREDLSFSVPDF